MNINVYLHPHISITVYAVSVFECCSSTMRYNIYIVSYIGADVLWVIFTHVQTVHTRHPPPPGYEAIAHYSKLSQHIQWSPLIRTTLRSFQVSCLVRYLIEEFHCMY